MCNLARLTFWWLEERANLVKNATDSYEQGNQPSNGEVASKSEATTERMRRSEDVASRLAYECGWRTCEDNLRALEGQRTRSLALLSVSILIGGIAVSVLLGRDLLDDLGVAGVVGGSLSGLGVLIVAVCAAWVSWPLETMASLRPKKIIENYVNLQHSGKTETWVYKNLATNLDAALEDLNSKVKFRTGLYMGSLVSTMFVLGGVVMMVFDVTF